MSDNRLSDMLQLVGRSSLVPLNLSVQDERQAEAYRT
jgi:hypothetical protein